MSRKIICIDGNIGAGKSTVLSILSSRGFTILQENVATWQPYLTHFYNDNHRWSLTCQLKILLSLTKSLPVNQSTILVERDPYACGLFTRNAYNSGLMNKLEYSLFNDYYDAINPWVPTCRVYLDVNTSECLRRIKQRDREGECKITEKYLIDLENIYLKYLHPDVVIDGHKSPEVISNQIISLI
jgi:deoxyadenosine/deoxycytidine kinase